MEILFEIFDSDFAIAIDIEIQRFILLLLAQKKATTKTDVQTFLSFICIPFRHRRLD